MIEDFARIVRGSGFSGQNSGMQKSELRHERWKHTYEIASRSTRLSHETNSIVNSQTTRGTSVPP